MLNSVRINTEAMARKKGMDMEFDLGKYRLSVLYLPVSREESSM